MERHLAGLAADCDAAGQAAADSSATPTKPARPILATARMPPPFQPIMKPNEEIFKERLRYAAVSRTPGIYFFVSVRET